MRNWSPITHLFSYGKQAAKVRRIASSRASCKDTQIGQEAAGHRRNSAASVCELFSSAQPARPSAPGRRQYDATAGQPGASCGCDAADQPQVVALRSHLAKLAIRHAKLKDFSEVETPLGLLQAPLDEHPAHEAKAGFPPNWAVQIEISCSS
ncbi:hypothetical protein [Ramlibacter sp.]|uniref:hypothetical protein n=1 Tax=Ramlibacter sp. TaxID=1917967 RepID=UPI00178D3ADF|nr:hypothetical protein [Ramlibacter sp.]